MKKSNYTKVLQRIVNKPTNNVTNPKNISQRQKIIDEFVGNSKNMFNMYYRRAAAIDSLNGLTDERIVDAVAARPTKLKKKSKKLLKFLDKHGVTLTETGEVDYSAVENPNIVKKLQENPLIKTVLMQRDLAFEIPHKEVQMKMAQELRSEREEYKVKLDEMIESMKEKVEENPFEIATDDSPFHKELGVKYPTPEPVPIPQPKIKKQIGDITEEEVLSTEATYRIFESYDSRMARLEKKWLQHKIAQAEGGIDKVGRDERIELLKNAISKLRRVKYLVDQKNLSNAQSLMFREHRIFSSEDLLNDT